MDERMSLLLTDGRTYETGPESMTAFGNVENIRYHGGNYVEVVITQGQYSTTWVFPWNLVKEIHRTTKDAT